MNRDDTKGASVTAEAFSFASIEARGRAAGLAVYALLRRGQVSADDVATKLDIRARILRDIAPAVGSSTTGTPLDLPVGRQRNVEWAADELEAAGELIRRLSGTVPRTAQDAFNEYEAKTLREHRNFLLGLVKGRLSPLRLRALEVLKEAHFASTLAPLIGVSAQHAGNICAALYDQGLLTREEPAPHLSKPGRTAWMYRTVDAIHGPERYEEELESIRAKARELREAGHAE
jgi:hypothetical protein